MTDDNEENIKARLQFQENYYSILAIDEKATAEEIVASYRRLSKLFHPDKHTDPNLKKDAENLFNKLKQAYEVLIDEQKRAIYDTIGVEGLKTEGWQLVARSKSADTIREEYNRLVKLREEQRLMQQTNARGTLSVTIDATDLFAQTDDEDEEDYKANLLPTIEMTSFNISQNIDIPLTRYQTSTVGGNLSTQNGRGQGHFVGSLRHVVSNKTWVELQFLVGKGPVITIKGFRTISKRQFASAEAYVVIGARGVAPGTKLVYGKQLEKNIIGYLTWKTWIQPALNTSLVWNNPKHQLIGAVEAGVKNSFCSLSYVRKVESDTKFRLSLKISQTDFVSIEYGCDTKLSQLTTIGASVSIGATSGVSLKLKATRSNQNFVCHFLLSEDVFSKPIFYGTVIPIVAYYSMKMLVINPFIERENMEEIQKAKAENAAKLAEKRKTAEAARFLMQEKYRLSLEQESARSGLIIIKAQYGKEVDVKASYEDESVPPTSEMFDVTVQMQCLVNNSSLVLPPASKADLPGFYDPCFGENKNLFVKYRYKELVHQTICDDSDQLSLPHNSHLGT